MTTAITYRKFLGKDGRWEYRFPPIVVVPPTVVPGNLGIQKDHVCPAKRLRVKRQNATLLAHREGLPVFYKRPMRMPGIPVDSLPPLSLSTGGDTSPLWTSPGMALTVLIVSCGKAGC